MTKPISPPDESVIRKFLLGTLPTDEAEGVKNWMIETPDAAELLERIEAYDRVIEALNDTGGIAKIDTSAELGLVFTAVQLSPPPACRPDLPARLGEYRIVRELGRGGMGLVLEAENTLSNQGVAIKLIGSQYANDPAVRERFLQEGRAVAKIDHPNVVPILHVGEDGGHLFIVMPLLKGETLDARLKREKRPLRVADILRIGREVAAGLAAAHAVGLVHRDIKPANIWLDADTGRARLLDFGLAKPLEQPIAHKALTRTGVIVGTPTYMAPEQAEGRPVDSRTDLFSLGCVLYHAATGERPFKGDTELAVLLAVTKDTPEPPERLNPDLSPQLAAVIRALLEKNPDNRADSATAVMEALAEFATEPTWVQRARRSAFPSWAVAAGVLLVLGIAAATYQLVFATKDGTLIVDVVPDAEVRFKNGELHIYGDDGKLKYKLKASERNAKLLSGGYHVKVIGADGVELETPEFTMTKDGKVILRVVATSRAAPLPGPGPVQSPDPDRTAAEYVQSRGGQGRYVLVNGDERGFADGNELPKEAFRLTGVTLKGAPVTEAGLAAFKGCKNLTELDLWDTLVSDAGLEHFKDCKNLTRLVLSGPCVSDAGLAHFKDCKNLTKLVLDCENVTDAGLAHFKDCHYLTILYIFCDRVSDAGVVYFKDCKSLTELQLGHTGASDAGWVSRWSDEQDGPSITVAQFRMGSVWEDGPSISDAGLANFKDCKNLTVLQLTCTPLSDAGLANFKDCKNLTVLKLRGEELSDTGLAYFKDCKNLRVLQLHGPNRTYGPNISDAGLAYFKDCKNLRVLQLHGPIISDAGLANFKDCKDLMLLDLSGPEIGDAGLANFKDCKDLWYLDLNYTKAGDAGLTNFKDCRGLQELSLIGTRVTDAGLANFKHLARLYYLDLGFTKIGDAGLAHLKDWQALRYLRLPGTKISDAGLDHLRNCYLRHLDLGHTQVTDAGLVHLKAYQYLTHLNLWDTPVTDAGLAHFKRYYTLTHLNLDQTKISDAGLAHLKDCRYLTHLDLSRTKISDNGLAHLKGHNFQRLDLGRTQVTDAGLAHLKDCKNLTQLDLSDTKIGDAAIADLKEFKNLTRLELYQVDVSELTIAELAKALPKCWIEWGSGRFTPKK